MAPPDGQPPPVISYADWIFQNLRKHAVDGKIAQVPESHGLILRFHTELPELWAQIFADDGTSRTYPELLRDSVYVAAGLSAMGLQNGDIVSIISRNSHDIFALALGCVMAGVTIAPSLADLPVGDLKNNISLVAPKAVLARKQNLSAVKEAIALVDSCEKPQLHDIDEFFKEAVLRGSKTDVATFAPAKIDDPQSHVFLIIFSSGTTGPQKGVQLRDYGFIYNCFYASPFGRKYSGPILATTQIFWGTWWFTLMRGLENGRVRIFVDQIDTFGIADAIHKYKPSSWYGSITGVTPMLTAIQENPGRWDFSSLKVAFTTGNTLDAALHETLEKTFKTKVLTEFGSTEMGVQFTADLDAPTVYGSVGKSVSEIKLVDTETGEEIKEPFRNGELLTKYVVMKGYINNETATKEAFDAHGWFKSGDVLYFDNDGNYFAVDRFKEMFKYRDLQIAPTDLESLIRKVPGVAEVVVVGKKADITIGQLPTAFIVKKENSKLTEQDVHDFLEKAKIHDAKKLRGGVFFIEEIPKNANGKLVRRKLQDIANEMEAA